MRSSRSGLVLLLALSPIALQMALRELLLRVVRRTFAAALSCGAAAAAAAELLLLEPLLLFIMEMDMDISEIDGKRSVTR